MLILVFSVNMKNRTQFVSGVPCISQASVQQIDDLYLLTVSGYETGHSSNLHKIKDVQR